jgi:hypothetical protein
LNLDFLIKNLHAEKTIVQETLTEISAIDAGDEFVFTLIEITNLPVAPQIAKSLINRALFAV